MAMVAVTAALIGFFAFVIMRVTTPQMTTLFTDLSIEDSSAIIKDLDRQAIPYELTNVGPITMVPHATVPPLPIRWFPGPPCRLVTVTSFNCHRSVVPRDRWGTGLPAPEGTALRP